MVLQHVFEVLLEFCGSEAFATQAFPVLWGNYWQDTHCSHGKSCQDEERLCRSFGFAIQVIPKYMLSMVILFFMTFIVFIYNTIWILLYFYDICNIGVV